MRVVEAPEPYETWADETAVFRAGGISGCPDWLADTNLALLNPRRAHFPMENATAAEAQSCWEFTYLRAWRQMAG